MENITPVVGMGATLHFPQDTYPYVIVAVSKSGKSATIERLHTVDKSTGHEPSRFDGPFSVWDHVYTPEELQAHRYTKEEIERFEAARVYTGEKFLTTIRLGKNGWGYKGLRFTVGTARYHRNFSY